MYRNGKQPCTCHHTKVWAKAGAHPVIQKHTLLSEDALDQRQHDIEELSRRHAEILQRDTPEAEEDPWQLQGPRCKRAASYQCCLQVPMHPLDHPLD